MSEVPPTTSEMMDFEPLMEREAINVPLAQISFETKYNIFRRKVGILLYDIKKKNFDIQ